MTFVIGVIVLVIGLMLSIALHEIGHLLPAKRFGVRVPQYFVGFGRTLWSFRRGETEYGIKAIPFGGFVRMIGMFPPASPQRQVRRRRDGRVGLVEEARLASAEEVAPGEEHRAFYSLSVPKKMVVMLGGPVMNLVIAFVLIAVLIGGIGVATLTNSLGTVSECLPEDPAATECAASDPVAPAYAAGLREGDTIVAWAGAPVADWQDVTAAITAGGTAPVSVQILRDGAEQAVTVTPTLVERPVVVDGEVQLDEQGEPVTEPRPFVGISPAIALERQPLTTVPARTGEVLLATVEVVLTLPQRLVSIAGSVFGGQERDPDIIGIVGVGRFAGEIASVEADGYGAVERAADLMGLIASLNLALFVFNLLPLLPLDGGHIAGALWEGLRRQLARLRGRPDPGPVDTARLLPLTYVVVTLLLGMTLLLAVADIVNPISLFR